MLRQIYNEEINKHIYGLKLKRKQKKHRLKNRKKIKFKWHYRIKDFSFAKKKIKFVGHHWTKDFLSLIDQFTQFNHNNILTSLFWFFVFYIDNIIINVHIFFQKLFFKIINATSSFQQKKIFLIRARQMIFFDMVKKYTIFVQKLITQ